MTSIIILILLTLLQVLPCFILLFTIKKDRKKYFIISSIYILIFSFILFKFGEKILIALGLKSGIANYTIYLYKYLFIFSPFLSLFFTSIHKLLLKKWYIILLVSLKYVLPIFLGLILSNFIALSRLLWLLAFYDLLTTIISVIFAFKV